MTIYLYVKTHNITGLKYLGKTTRDPYKYKGSGKRWCSHIKKYGYNVDTKILLETTNKEDITTWGLYYSKLWNVVERNDWANIIPESGSGGSTNGMLGKCHTKETKEIISSKNKGKTRSLETRSKMTKNHVGHIGKKHSETTKRIISATHTGKIVSADTKSKMRLNSKSKKPIKTPKGLFNSIIEASEHLKLHRDTIRSRIKTQPLDYYYCDK